jgi:hypothetical protein
LLLPVVGCCALVAAAGCSGGGGGDSPPAATATAMVDVPATATATAVATATSSPPPASPTATGPPAITPTPTHSSAPDATPTDTPTVGLPSPPATPTNTATSAPTATPSMTPLTGPLVSAFGLAEGGGTFDVPGGPDDEGRLIFTRRSAAGFIIYVEGRLGPSQLPVGTVRFNSKAADPSAQPDLQMVASNHLGRPTTAVCDGAFPVRGGVPAVEPPDFDTTTTVSDALNDLACRFKLFAETDFACTQDSRGNYVFANGSSSVQFCILVDDALTFPTGETVLTVRLRDVAGNAGPPAQIVVRVVSDSP